MDRGYERLVLIEKPWGQEGEKLVEPEHPHDGRLQDEVGDEEDDGVRTWKRSAG